MRLPWRVYDDVGCARANKLWLVPGTSALLVGEPIHDYNGARGWKRVNHRSNYCGRDHDRGSDRRCRCDWVVAAATAIVAAVDINVMVNVNVYVPVRIDVAVDIRVVVDVGVYGPTVDAGSSAATSTLREHRPAREQQNQCDRKQISDRSVHFTPSYSYFFALLSAALTSAIAILCASFGGSKVKAASLNEGAKFHIRTSLKRGRASSSTVVSTSFRGNG